MYTSCLIALHNACPLVTQHVSTQLSAISAIYTSCLTVLHMHNACPLVTQHVPTQLSAISATCVSTALAQCMSMRLSASYATTCLIVMREPHACMSQHCQDVLYAVIGKGPRLYRVLSVHEA